MFTLEIKIPKYDWTADVFEPSIIELEGLQTAYNEHQWGKVAEIWAPMIKAWDFTDRSDRPLPVSAESMQQIPHTVLKALTQGLFELIMRGDSDPKKDSSSSPTLISVP